MNTTQESIRWLHISDLHILLNDPSWTDYKNFLLRFFDERPAQKPDFIVITGDYRNIQKQESYELAEHFISELLEKLGLSREKDLFMIPGNHDTLPQRKDSSGSVLDRRLCDLKNLLPDGLSPWEEKEDAALWRSKNESDPADYLDRLCNESRTEGINSNAVYISTLLAGFDEYQRMVYRLISWYDESGWTPASPHIRKWERDGGNGFNIVHLNSAIVADGSHCHYQALDLTGAKKAFYNIKNGLPTLVLSHNSFYDLHPKIQEQLKPTMRMARVCAWLCGDTHLFNMDESISCPTGVDTAYSIPIFVCGKGAPDHSDDYSQHGFILYQSREGQLTTHQITWDRHIGMETQKTIERPLANPDIPSTSTAKSKRLYIGYLSCNPAISAEDKYHLGHAYFIHTIDQWRKNNDVVLLTSSYVFAHNRGLQSIQTEADYVVDMVQRWEDCFNRQVKVIDIKHYLAENNPLDENERRLLCYLAEMEMKLDSNKEWMDFIDTWNKSGIINNLAYESILKVADMEGHPNAYTRDEVMSFLYLLYKRPHWYTSTWLINFLHFWNNQLYSLVRNTFGLNVEPNDIFIVEAKRNHYVWDAITYCAKRFSYTNVPKVEYFDNLLDKNCRHPMKSSSHADAVFLKDCKKGNNFHKRFKEHIQKMFDTERSPDEIAEEYCERLSLEY